MNNDTNNRMAAIETALFAALVFLLYLVTLSGNLSASHDSALYANTILAAQEMYHPHHLLYFPLAWLWYQLWQFAGGAADITVAVPVLNALFGALAASMVYLLLRNRMCLSRGTAAAGAALPVFSFGFWFYSVCIEVYIIPLFFLLLTLYFLSDKKANAKTFAIAGAAHGLAVLFHQVNILFTPVVLLAMLLRKKQGQPLGKLFLAYSATVTPVVAVPYLVVMLGVEKLMSIQAMFHWLTLYGHSSSYWYPLAVSTLAKAIYGFGRSIIGAHYILAPPVRELATTLKPGQSFTDKTFLVRNMSPFVAWMAIVLSAAAGVLSAVLVVVRLKKIPGVLRRHNNLILPVLTWLACYSCFFFFWDPWNIEFWIPQSVCVWLLFVALISSETADKPKRAPAFLAAVAVCLFCVNFLGSMLWMRGTENDYFTATIKPLQRLSTENDLIISPQDEIWRDYLRLYTNLDARSLATIYEDAKETAGGEQAVERAVDDLHKLIDDTLSKGGKVLVLENAVDLSPNTLLLHGQNLQAVTKAWEQYREHWEKKDIGGPTDVYIIDGEPGTIE